MLRKNKQPIRDINEPVHQNFLNTLARKKIKKNKNWKFDEENRFHLWRTNNLTEVDQCMDKQSEWCITIIPMNTRNYYLYNWTLPNELCTLQPLLPFCLPLTPTSITYTFEIGREPWCNCFWETSIKLSILLQRLTTTGSNINQWNK